MPRKPKDADNDRAEARAVLRDRTELLGLAASRRHELSGQAGATLLSQADLVAQVRAAIDSKAARLVEQGREHDDERG